MSQSQTPEKLTESISPTNLTDLESACWHQLVSGADDGHDGFHTMTIATCTNRGADARMVVLRRVDAIHKYVWFHTDARSEKVLQLEAFPMSMLLFWDHKRRIQLRLSVETRLHTDDYIADDHWDTLSATERKLYFSIPRPGSELPEHYTNPLNSHSDHASSDTDLKRARNNFAVIECRVLAMEYLFLNPEGHIRALFQYEPESRMTWLAP